jgi:hypothetical protein
MRAVPRTLYFAPRISSFVRSQALERRVHAGCAYGRPELRPRTWCMGVEPMGSTHLDRLLVYQQVVSRSQAGPFRRAVEPGVSRKHHDDALGPVPGSAIDRDPE